MIAPHETPATDLPPVLPTPGAVPGRRRARLRILAAWCAWSAAAAQTPDERALLGEVPSASAASKYDQPLSEGPADVSIVNRAEILRGAKVLRNLFDATLADPAGPKRRQDCIPLPGRQFVLKPESVLQ